MLLIIRDATDRKKPQTERELLIRSLEEALANVKTLRGMVPICAACKQIRDDKGYWNQVEAHVPAHSEAKFSHGICPDCARKLYLEFPSALAEKDSRKAAIDWGLRVQMRIPLSQRSVFSRTRELNSRFPRSVVFPLSRKQNYADKVPDATKKL